MHDRRGIKQKKKKHVVWQTVVTALNRFFAVRKYCLSGL